MTARSIAYKVRVAEAGASTIDGSVDFELTAELAAAPTIPGPVIDPVTGQTRTRPWSVEVIDADDVISSRMADAGGRMHLLGRLVDLQASIDGGAYSTIITGRLSDLNETSGPGLWQLQVEDERWIERATRVFTATDTTQVHPAGPRYQYRSFERAPTRLFEAIARVGNLAVFQDVGTYWDGTVSGSRANIGRGSPRPAPAARELIVADVIPDAKPSSSSTSGSFLHLRARVDGADYEVAAFSYVLPAADFRPPENPADSVEQGSPIAYLWLVWPDDPPSDGERFEISFYMPTREPTDEFPLHIGVKDSGHAYGTAEGGIHPFELLRRLYEEKGVRYDAAAMAALIADPRYAPIEYRATGPEVLAQFAEDHIYGPNQVAAFINAAGEVSPRPLHLPQDVDPDQLPQLTPSNQAEHPTFRHTRREVVNAIRFKYRHESWIPDEEFFAEAAGREPLDRIRTKELELTREHDNLEALGVQDVTVRLDGYHTPGGGEGFAGDPLVGADRERMADFIAREIFDRYGDGPIAGRIVGMLSTESIEPGDLVVMSLPTFPNPVEAGRGGDRIIQILSRDLTPAGPEFEYIDVGPKLQPLASPTVAIAKNVAEPTRDVDVTVSDVPEGGRVQVQLAYSDSEPTSTSDLWFTAATDLDAGSVTLRGNPTGAKVWARGRATAVGRIRSGWSDAVSVQLDAELYVRRVRVAIDDRGTPFVSWEENGSVGGVRVSYGRHGTSTPPNPLGASIDLEAGVLELELPIHLEPGEYITVEVEPYPGYSAGTVTGSPGVARRAVARRPTVAEALLPYSLINFREVAASAPGRRRWEFTRGSLVASVWWAFRKYDAPWSDDNWSDVAKFVEPLPAGQNYVEVDEVPGNQVGALQVEPRLADLSVFDGDVVERVPIFPIPPVANGWIRAEYEEGIAKVYIGAEPTASAVPVSFVVRMGSHTGPIIASGKWGSVAAAQLGAGPSDLPGLTQAAPTFGRLEFWLQTTDVAGNKAWTMDAIESVREDGIADVAQFAASFAPIKRVDELPAAGARVGERVFVFNPSDPNHAKLFRWDGASWVEDTPAAGSFLYQPVIVANAISAVELAADAVRARNIAAEAVQTIHLAAESVTADKLAALTLEVGKYIESSNYDPMAGVGFRIDGGGSAFFGGDVTVIGTIAAGSTIATSQFTAENIDLAAGGRLILRPEESFGWASVDWRSGATQLAQIRTQDDPVLGTKDLILNTADAGRRITFQAGGQLRARFLPGALGANETGLQLVVGPGDFEGIRQVVVSASGVLMVQ